VLEIPFDFAPIAKERKKYLELVDALNAARRRVRDLEAGRPAAKKIDEDRFAAAILKSGAAAKDPGRKATEELEQELEQAMHLVGSTKSAVEQAEAKLVEAVEMERDAIVRKLDQTAQKLDTEYGKSAEAFLTARRERDQLQRLRTQLTRFPKPTKDSVIERPFPVLKVNGTQLSHKELERAVRGRCRRADPQGEHDASTRHTERA
jgi:hypothetical protein